MKSSGSNGLRARVATHGYDTEVRVHIRFVDPFTQQTVEDYGVVAEKEAERYPPGARRDGLYAPQWPRPALTTAPPDHAAERSFVYKAAAVLAIIGVALILVAWKTGRLLAS